MKVLFVSSGNSKFGISPIVYNQGESLKKENIKVDYFTIKGKGIKGYLRSIKDLKKKTKKESFNIIHAHFGLSAIVALLGKRNEKIIASFMGDDLVGANDLNGKIRLLSLLLVKLNRFLAKYFYDFNIVKSKEMQNVLKISNSVVISNGVDFSRFFEIDKETSRKKLDLIKDIKQVLFCSDPKRPEKNFKLANEAVALLPFSNVELSVIYNLKQEDLVHYYNAADCLILTSFHEGSPNVIKEAMACNIPIVSTDVGDVKDVISKTNGCFISSFEPNDVADKIQKAFEYDKRTTGREDIKHLESSIVAKKIINIYKIVLRS